MVCKRYSENLHFCNYIQGMRYEFGSVGAVCSIKESSGPQNQRVHIVLKAWKSVGAKGDVPKICGCTRCTRSNAFPDIRRSYLKLKKFLESWCENCRQRRWIKRDKLQIHTYTLYINLFWDNVYRLYPRFLSLNLISYVAHVMFNYSSKKIRKAHNEDMNIACQNLNALQLWI